ncbi:MAG: DUF58 domain-containing protein [Bacteroidia bacterium]|jgi:uncharacterized protein (DUF58 family)|nr:DUF58 domain-containing protein [Bacteroidia bacterium]
METSELLKKVRRIELKTRSMSSQVFSGEYHSAFKGRGMTFSEVREYQPGDEVRTIDWNVTARLNHPYVKVFQEERELTAMILVDMSASGAFGTHAQMKRELLTEVCAVLSFSAIQNNDKAGVCFFSDSVERFIAPRKGRPHILRIIRELVEMQPLGKGTNLETALDYCTNALKQRCILFVLSDFMAPDAERMLRMANRRHDVVCINIFDRREQELPDAGIIQIEDPETGTLQWVDTSNARVRQEYARQARMHRLRIDNMFKRCGVDATHIATGDDYVKILSALFHSREKRAIKR